MSPFYSIKKSNQLTNSPYQLDNLGEERPMVTIGRAANSFWGTEGTPSKTYYRKTTVADYDNNFAYRIVSLKPPYDLSKFLDYHLSCYLLNENSEKEIFLKQIKYVILPLVKKRKNSEIYIDLLNEWLEKNDLAKNQKTINAMNTINIGNINAPTQFQQDSNNSIQTQNINPDIESLGTFFNLLRKDIELLSSNLKEEFESEINYSIRQLEKGKQIKEQLLNIGGLIKDVGINVFANLIASPIYESFKLLLGIN